MRHMKITFLEKNGSSPPMCKRLAQMYPKFNPTLPVEGAGTQAQYTVLQRKPFRSSRLLNSQQIELGGNELRSQVVQLPSEAVL